MQDAARNLVKHEADVAQIDGVPRVRAALVADDPVRALGEHVDQLAFALVTPLRADDDDRAIGLAKHDDPCRSGGGERQAKKYAPELCRGVE